MSNWIQMFQTENARFQIERGMGVLVKAANLTTLQLGRGIYRELHRDSEWLFISDISQSTEGSVVIEYLQLTTTKSREDKVETTTEVTTEQVVKHKLTFGPSDEILISLATLTRPKGRRITDVTTRVRKEEPLEDQ
jgi:hypothetical protein